MKVTNIETLDILSEFFKLFSDTTRLRIMDVLLNGELCVSDIAKILEVDVSLVSHQLKYLKSSNFVKSRRQGKSIIYMISDDHIKIIMEYGLEHIKER